MILFRYIIKDFFKYVTSTLVLCVFLFVLFDFIHKTTNYLSKYQPSSGHLAQYYLYQIPGLVVQSLPICALIASVVTMVLLGRTNEVTAMRAAGMSPLRIGLPIIMGSFLLTGLSFVTGEGILPLSAQKMHYIQQVLIEKESDEQNGDSTRWFRRGKQLFNYREFVPLNNLLLGVSITEVGPSFRPIQILEAESAFYQLESDNWILRNVKITKFWQNGTISSVERKTGVVTSLPIDPRKLTKERRMPNEQSLHELRDTISRGESIGADVTPYSVDMNIKLAFHFSSVVVSLIGLKFGYRSERSTETARGVLLGIAVGVGYWVVLSAGRAMAKGGAIHPILGAWSANIVIALYALYQIRKASR